MMSLAMFNAIQVGDKVRKDGTKTVRTVEAVNVQGIYRTIILVSKGAQINAIQNVTSSTVIPSFYHNWHVVVDGPEKDTYLADHFTPGNVILSDYWKMHDRVIAFHPSTAERGWSVDVIHCDVHGTPVAGEVVRNHCTYPDRRDKIVGRVQATHTWCMGVAVRSCPICCSHMVAFDSAILHQRPFSNILRGDIRTFNEDKLSSIATL